jgi:alpha-L-arabinofuranosidase
MDKSDPQKRVALIVDEWGAWHAVEPGTNPGFLYQQNTLRDALVAALTLNIFNRHCDRVKMANIAQMVNVLQAMILTDGAKLVLTPTYHVFEMYTVHHDAQLLPSDLDTANYVLGPDSMAAVQASVSRDKARVIHVSLCNSDPNRPAELTCNLQGAKARKISGRVLSAPTMQAHNTFDQPQALQPAPFSACQLAADGFTAMLPPKSVVVLAIE